MQPELKIALVQANLVWQNVEANLSHLESLIENLSDVDVIVLPEMFATAFSMNTNLAEFSDGKSVQWMKKIAFEKNAAICGSLMIQEKGAFFNRLFWVNERGEVAIYNKRHLFSLSDEPKHFTAGEQRLLVEYKGWRFCPMICYDLRFPVWSRNNLGYDVLLYVANWPQKRSLAWKTLLPARAIENQCYVVAVNRVGEDGNGMLHSGNSAVYDALGNAIFQVNNSQEAVIMATLVAKELKEVRSQFPFLNDRDTFEFTN